MCASNRSCDCCPHELNQVGGGRSVRQGACECMSGMFDCRGGGAKHQRTADPFSMDALDPAKRMPRQQRRARKAAFPGGGRARPATAGAAAARATPISSGDHRRQTKQAHPMRASPSHETNSHHPAAALKTQHRAAAARCTAARPGEARAQAENSSGRCTLLRGSSLPRRHLAVRALLLRLRAAACLSAVGWT